MGDSFRIIAVSYCMGISIVQKIIQDVVDAIWDELVHEHLAPPYDQHIMGINS